MLASIQSSGQLNTFALPAAVGGAHRITDAAGQVVALVEGREGLWCVEAAGGARVRTIDGEFVNAVELPPDALSVVNVEDGAGRTWCLVFQPEDAQALSTAVYGFAGDAEITVGRAADNRIVYGSGFVSGHHAKLVYRSGRWYIGDPGSVNGVFLNGTRISAGETIKAGFGDVISILGLRITLGAGFFSCNNPGGDVRIREDGLVRYRAPKALPEARARAAERAPFYPALRFARSIERKQFSVDAPPQREKEEKTSLLQRIGPSMIMGFASLMSACVFVMLIFDSGSSPVRALPMVLMAVSMLAGSVVWPIVNDRKKREEREKAEVIRRGAYTQYLSGVLTAIAAEEDLQREILKENRLPVSECMAMAARADVHLMERTALHDDYLDVRIGVGDEPLAADIRFPDAHFTVDDDELRKEVDAQAAKPRILSGVPLAFPLVDRGIVGIVGASGAVHPLARGVVVQVAALCSYEDVKVVVLCDEGSRGEWEFARVLPHCFSDDRTVRFFACGLEETAEVGMYLERLLEERKAQQGFVGREARPYFVVVCASAVIAEKAAIVRSLVEVRENLGMSLVALAPAMHDLPRECRSVIGVDQAGAYLLDRDDASGKRRRFAPDIAVSRSDAERFALDLARLRLDLAVEKQQIPAHLGFLEMHGAGSVEQLNIASRWRESNAAASLACRVGVDAQGEPFLLNLHEKSHGPHGLIAGTTGSGKSEFIITWILSMALTYSPDDVAFVLIDYKGGGLARAFDNEHVRLPHLAGVITNLDGAAIRRSLVSIQSELKRRQALFNRARDVVGGDNVDIYDYLDLFRQGRMDEPCPHLFIVADEFAELKAQEPDFMDELISAARIGRSLGVHLVLATQKPSGVVNDQIWSNARFKVCLKVADAADSKEMIRRPDAAELREAGRFYLLVGYNELFSLGQAAYAGARYVPRERLAESRDDAVVLISDTGQPLVSVKPQARELAGEGRPESVVALGAVQRAAEALGVRARQLWLEPVPAIVEVDALRAKYGRDAKTPIAGDAVGQDSQPESISAAAGSGASRAEFSCAAEASGNEVVREVMSDSDSVILRAKPEESPQVGTLEILRGAQNDGNEAVRGDLIVDPVIGEYDDPNRQRQGILSLPLSEKGNALVYGTPESGVEMALNALVYSLTCDHGASEVNVYVLDFGSESLRAFAAAPQVGDVIGVAEEEKVRRFFSFIEGEFASRRSALAECGGSLARYARERGEMPAIVIILNDIAAFLETYPKLEDRLTRLIRESGRSGAYLVVTAAGSSSVRVRMRQGFRQILAVNLADASDYGMIFGSMRGLPEPKGLGRGLAQLEDGVYEFQAARLTGAGDDFAFAMRHSAALADEARDAGGREALPVPMPPEVVSPEMISGFAMGDFVPYGIYDDDLSVAGFSFADSPLARCQFQRRRDGASFLRALLTLVVGLDRWDVAVLDMARLLSVSADAPNGERLASSVEAGLTLLADDDERAWDFLTRDVLTRQAARADGTRLLLAITGVADFIARADRSLADGLKAFLREPPVASGVSVVLLDPAAGNSYAYEEWFKANLTSKDGLWVGPGVESQTAIGITYTGARFVPDSEMNATRGYEVAGGITRLVRLTAPPGHLGPQPS